MARTPQDLFGPQPRNTKPVYRRNDRVIDDQYRWLFMASTPAMNAAHSDLERQQQRRDDHDECDQLRYLCFAHGECLHGHGSLGIRAESPRVSGLPPAGRLGDSPIRARCGAPAPAGSGEFALPGLTRRAARAEKWVQPADGVPGVVPEDSGGTLAEPHAGTGVGGWTASSWISIPPIIPAAKLYSRHARAVKIQPTIP